LQLMSVVSPFTWCLRTVRAALIDGASISSEFGALSSLFVSIVLCWVVGLLCLDWGLRRAKRTGTLSRY
jgi:hypothetical protein